MKLWIRYVFLSFAVHFGTSVMLLTYSRDYEYGGLYDKWTQLHLCAALITFLYIFSMCSFCMYSQCRKKKRAVSKWQIAVSLPLPTAACVLSLCGISVCWHDQEDTPHRLELLWTYSVNVILMLPTLCMAWARILESVSDIGTDV